MNCRDARGFSGSFDHERPRCGSQNSQPINFRPLRDIEWNPGRLNVSIGPNASGKSNPLALFRVFRDAAANKLGEFVARNGGMEAIAHDGTYGAVELHAELSSTHSWESNRFAETIHELHIGKLGPYNSPVILLTMAELEEPELVHYTPLVLRAVDQAERRVFQGEAVPAGEKLYSLFEAHTELLVRGKAGKPAEFGHKVLIAQTGEKFISHYRVMPKREEDKDLVDETLAAHRGLFGAPPKQLAADKGFHESAKRLEELREEIETVSICKKGRRTEEEEAREEIQKRDKADQELKK